MTAAEAPPLVAIVTPVYNGAAFLAETMDCVQAQTYPNLVHIVLDNASTDATPDIIARYANKQVPVRVFRNPETLPIEKNWNAAAGHVPEDAKYVRFLSADDLMAPEFVARTADLLERHPDAVVAGCKVNIPDIDPDSWGWDADQEAFPGRQAVRRFFKGEGQIIADQILMRRSQLDERSPFFSADLAACDTDACLDMLRRGGWGFVHEVLATTRDHPATYSRAVGETMLQTVEYLTLLERHADFALGGEEGRARVRLYRRYYYRQLLRWLLRADWTRVDKHLARLRGQDGRRMLWELLDAVIDWPFARCGLRPVWKGYPFGEGRT